MAVTLINKSRRMRVYNLDSTFMSGLRGKKKTLALTVKMPDGAMRQKRVNRHIPGSLTLCAGEKCSAFSNGHDLPDEILKVESIARDIAAGKLRCVKSQPVVAAASKDTKPKRGRR